MNPKRLLPLLSASAAALALGPSAQAALVASDNFDYADGSSLTDSANWANHSGTDGDLLVSGGQAVVQHGTPSEDANIGFASVGGTIYFGLDFSVDDLGAPVRFGRQPRL